MRCGGIPGGKMSLWAGIAEPIVARDPRVFVVVPKQEIKIQVGNIRPVWDRIPQCESPRRNVARL
jgi:hypothetical protein